MTAGMATRGVLANQVSGVKAWGGAYRGIHQMGVNLNRLIRKESKASAHILIIYN